MFTSRTALVSTATVALIGFTGSTATAAPTCECSPPNHPTTVVMRTAAASAFAVPIQAIGGRNLAQYLSDHMERRLAAPGV